VKTVAVSQRVDDYPQRLETRDALDQRLIQWLHKAGYMPYPVPNVLCDAEALVAWLDVLQPAGIVLSGGNDLGQVGPRDRTEEALLNYAQQHSLPLLGICRGMQMMGAWAHTELKPVSGHVASRHTLAGEIPGTVNSYHSYSLATCPAGFRVLAKSEDGEIEAVRHRALPWEGWMWHPEREDAFSAQDLQRLRSLFGA
jgi:gamma-glutamyl-gamma-aminobutyrate hydrolase PuuD